MNKNNILYAFLFVVLLVIGLVISNVLRLNREVKDVKVEVVYNHDRTIPKSNSKLAPDLELMPPGDTLVTDSTLRNLILSGYPSILNEKLKEVDLKKVEHIASRNPYVYSAEASLSIRGEVEVHIEQRAPVLRLFTGQNEVYLTRDGRCIPTNPACEADVLVGSGVLKEKIKLNDSINLKKLAADTVKRNYSIVRMWKLACFLYDNPIYGTLFDQIDMLGDGDLQLVPKIGNHVVLLGGIDNLDTKFADLLVFYRNGLSKVGWDTYKTISLKYKGQIICNKREKK